MTPADIDRIIKVARRDTRCVSASETRRLCDEIERLRLYEQAIISMADQFVSPKTTAYELAKSILTEKGIP